MSERRDGGAAFDRENAAATSAAANVAAANAAGRHFRVAFSARWHECDHPECQSCQTSCQSACKTSCTVSNQPCPLAE